MAATKKTLALVIDDEPDIRELLSITLARMDVDVLAAADLREANALLQKYSFDICLTDMRLPDGDGLALVAHVQEYYPRLPVAVITAHGNMESAIQALKSGAFDFLSKPVDVKNLRTLVKTALKLREVRTESTRLLIGETQAIRGVKKMIARLSRSQAPVYISGASGVGKELVARMIHEQGASASGAFVPVNCGAIPAELMESEFFGHVKGSFTGAISDKQGLFHSAEGGTLFLDEVAELPSLMQVKLLRAIQEKSIRPVGSAQESSVNVRILSATHKDLEKLVQQDAFRQDLYYRLNVINLHVPSLKERSEDIPLIAENILQRHNERDGKRYTLSKKALEWLKNYGFPGNIRELENILERAVALCESDEINVDDLQLPREKAREKTREKTGEKAPETALATAVTDGKGLDAMLGEIERQSILEALEKTHWNKTKAAVLLGISFRALRHRLQRLGLDKK